MHLFAYPKSWDQCRKLVPVFFFFSPRNFVLNDYLTLKVAPRALACIFSGSLGQTSQALRQQKVKRERKNMNPKPFNFVTFRLLLWFLFSLTALDPVFLRSVSSRENLQRQRRKNASLSFFLFFHAAMDPNLIFLFLMIEMLLLCLFLLSLFKGSCSVFAPFFFWCRCREKSKDNNVFLH